jgi:hypothetical protein
LFVTTAEMAADALKLPFDIDGLLALMEEYDQEHGAERNTSAESYDMVFQICRSQEHKFFVYHDKSLPKIRLLNEVAKSPSQECWGRITNMAKEHTDGRLITQEIEIRKKHLEDILKDNGFTNKSTCLAAWRAMDVLDAEDATHPCRSRKIDPTSAKGTSEKVFVLRWFASEEEAAEVRAEKAQEAANEAKRKLQLAKKKQKLSKEIKDGDLSA